MRKKELGMRFLSMMLAVGMIVTSTFSGTLATSVKAEEVGSVSENAVSENDVSLEDISIEDISIEEIPEIELLEAQTKEQEGFVLEDSFEEISFQSLYQGNSLSCNSTKVSIDDQTREDGVIVSGKNKNLSEANFFIDTEVDFGDTEVSHFSVNMLAKRGTKTYLNMYMDDVQEPIAQIRLPIQQKEDNWSKTKVCSANLGELKLSGVHKFHFQLVDETTAADKKTSILLRSMQFTSLSIPVVNLNIDESYSPIASMNGDDLHETECYGDVTIEVPQGYASEFDPSGSYQGGTYKLDYIRGRGNSTWMAEKKPYKIKLDEAADLFGMGANKHWVLLANHYDNSLVRNRMTYQMGRDLGIAFTPDCVSVDVYMNNEYLGNYLLSEQIRVGESRVDIFDMEKAFEKKEMTQDSDLTGGYLLALEPYGNETGYGFSTDHGVNFYVESPESTYDTALYDRMPTDYYGNAEIPKEFVDTSRYALANSYISDYVQQVEDAIFGTDFKNAQGVSYRDLMDVDSAVAYFWMQEFSQNGDAYVTPSTYLHKDKDGKLCWGPLWDFDYVAWASWDYTNYEENDSSYCGFSCSFPWFKRLMQDPYFVEKVKTYWKENLKPEVSKVVAKDGLLTRYQNELSVSAQRNFERWGFTDFDFEEIIGEDGQGKTPTYEFEINRLRSWIQHRTKWVDDNLDTIEPRMIKVIFALNDEENMSFDATMNDEYYDFPETPQPKNEDDVFGGWYYDTSYVDEETGETITDQVRLSPGDWINESMPLDDDNALHVYAKWILAQDVVPVDIVHFERAEYNLLYQTDEDYYQYYSLKYSMAPYDATNMTLTWESSDEKVVKAEEGGAVLVCGPGEAVVTATTAEGKSFSVPVHVYSSDEVMQNPEEYWMSDFELTESEVELNERETKGVLLQAIPEKSVLMNGEEEISWITSNPQVATVENGLITAQGPGEALIIVRGCMMYGEPIYKFCRVFVKESGTQENPGIDEDPSNGFVDDESKDVHEEQNPEADKKPEKKKTDKVGTTFTKGNLKYKVTSIKGSSEVVVTGMVTSKENVSIPKTVKHNGTTYKITAIKDNAFSGNKKLSKVVIGANVTKIGLKAFYKCHKCKSVIINSKKLKKVGANAFKKLSKKAIIHVPKKSKTIKKKWFQGYTVEKA